MLNMTHEQRAAALAAARTARLAQVTRWAESAHLLRQDFADRGYWLKLAASFGVRMPNTNAPGTETRALRKAMRKCGVTGADLLAVFGNANPAHLAADNPTWPAWALVGLILEVAAGKRPH